MATSTDRYRVNEKNVTAKVIDGEAIIINLANGMYYSLESTGAAAWLLIGGGHTLSDAAAKLAERYAADASAVEADLAALAADLVEQQLVLPAAGDAPADAVSLDEATGDAYVKPVLNSYNDMGDVLALDPPLPQVEIENEPFEDAA